MSILIGGQSRGTTRGKEEVSEKKVSEGESVLCESCSVGLRRVGENEKFSLCRPCSWKWAEATRAKLGMRDPNDTSEGISQDIPPSTPGTHDRPAWAAAQASLAKIRRLVEAGVPQDTPPSTRGTDEARIRLLLETNTAEVERRRAAEKRTRELEIAVRALSRLIRETED